MMSNAEQSQERSAARVYLLSLRSPADPVVASRVDRLSEWMSRPQVWPGIDGRKLAAPDYYKHVVRAHYQHGQVVTPAEVGVALSHVAVMDDFLASASELAVVFEDDVVIKPESGVVLNASIPFVGPNDILVACDQDNLGYIGTARGRPLAVDGHCLEILRNDWRIVKRSCAYAIGRHAALHLRDTQKQGLWPSDDFRVLCPPEGRLLYCAAFGHPPDDEGSVVAPERALKAASRVPPMPLVRRLAAEVMRTFGPRIGRVSRDVRSRLNGYRPI